MKKVAQEAALVGLEPGTFCLKALSANRPTKYTRLHVLEVALKWSIILINEAETHVNLGPN